MVLDYSILISPYPLLLENIGSLKAIKLREIFDSRVTYKRYEKYLSMLFTTPDEYCQNTTDESIREWYSKLSDDFKEKMTMFDVLYENISIIPVYEEIFDFFFVEKVYWDKKQSVFFLYKEGTMYDEKTDTYYLSELNGNEFSPPIGIIHPGIFIEVCDVILQRCSIEKDSTEEDISKAKSNKVLEILKKLKEGRKKANKMSSNEDAIDLPHIMSALVAKSNSVNWENILNLTVYQLYEQFKYEQKNVYFDIQKTSVSVWGDKKNAFKGNEWYKNIN